MSQAISCVICAYNEASRISKVLDVAVGHPSIREVIVVDDGSTDATKEVVKKYPSVRLIALEHNVGKSRAFVQGVAASTGELIMCLDADSYISEDALSRAIIYFEDKKVKAVASNVKVAKTKGILNLVQVFEYILCYQMKKAQK